MPENRAPYTAGEPPAWAFSLGLADWWEHAADSEREAFMRGLLIGYNHGPGEPLPVPREALDTAREARRQRWLQTGKLALAKARREAP